MIMASPSEFSKASLHRGGRGPVEAELWDPNLGLLEKGAAVGNRQWVNVLSRRGSWDGSICRPKLGPWVPRASGWR